MVNKSVAAANQKDNPRDSIRYEHSIIWFRSVREKRERKKGLTIGDFQSPRHLFQLPGQQAIRSNSPLNSARRLAETREVPL
jgi:hypothetical protein